MQTNAPETGAFQGRSKSGALRRKLTRKSRAIAAQVHCLFCRLLSNASQGESLSVAASKPSYRLGIELGVATVGWALISLNDLGNPIGLLRAGVRVFAPGVDGPPSEIEQGRDRSRSLMRKIARTNRRLVRRRAYRKQKLFALLQGAGLLPQAGVAEPISEAQARHLLLAELDLSLSRKWSSTEIGSKFVQRPMHVLRTAALDRELQPYEIGRVLFHLCQHRGFRWNTLARSEKDYSQVGPIHAGITELARRMEEAGVRTSGEYFSMFDAQSGEGSEHGKCLSREMREREFDLIWTKQETYHPDLLSRQLREEIRRILLVDRPIGKRSHHVGFCEWEGENHRRAAWATLEAQRFRILQNISRLKVLDWKTKDTFALSQRQREAVFDLLDQYGDLSLVNLEKNLKLGHNLRLRLDGATGNKVPGNRTNQIMMSAFGQRWGLFSEHERSQIVEEWRTIPYERSLIRRGISRWGLDQADSISLAHAIPESGYCNLSRRAIRKLLPLLLEGKQYKEATDRIYGEQRSKAAALESLPALEVHGGLRASDQGSLLKKIGVDQIVVPGLERSLTELRKLVNSLIREYGAPSDIHFELRRELKLYRLERLALTAKLRRREQSRHRVETRLATECGVLEPTRQQVETALLHIECGGVCPYTGQVIPFADLVSEMSPFRVEHIIPIDRFPDDSFQNKVICWSSDQTAPSHLTPFERFGGDRKRWAEVVNRVENWKQENPNKLRRITITGEEQLREFIAGQITDVRHASTQTARYLGSLFGEHRLVYRAMGQQGRVFPNSGVLTSTLRRAWGLDRLSIGNVNEGDSSFRSDYRRHAVNAIVTALSRNVLRGTEARARRGRSKRLQLPWRGFVSDVRREIAMIAVSHRPEHKLAGALHDETFYSPPYFEDGKSFVHIRKPVAGLSPREIADIVDPAVRRAVLDKAQDLDGNLSDCEQNQDWPLLIGKDGQSRPIKRVRVRKLLRVRGIGSDHRLRYVALERKHHVSVFAAEESESEKEVRWFFRPVSLFEATERKRKRMPIVEKIDHEHPEAKFKFSLMRGDTVEVHRRCCHELDSCRPEFFALHTIQANGQLGLVNINNGQTWRQNIATKQWLLVRAEGLRKLGCRKVTIDIMGKIHPAHD